MQLNALFPLYQLQEVWACWCELLSYLEQENTWMDLLEQKLNEMENIQGGADKIAEALVVSSCLMFFWHQILK